MGATEAQLDWVLKMHSEFPPGKLKWQERGDAAFTTAATGWANVLMGSALGKYMSAFMPAFSISRRARKKEVK